MIFVLQWHLTERCNLSCTHCYQNESIIKEELSLEENFEVVDKFVAFIQTLPQPSRGIINLTGGEPFAYAQLEPLLAYISKFKKVISFNFLSNGTLINDKTIELLQHYRPSWVQISIDGDEKNHDLIRGRGAFKRSVNGIKRLKAIGIEVLLSFTAHKQNYKSFPSVVKVVHSIEVERVWSDRLIPEGVGIGMSELLLSPKETRHYVQILKWEQIKAKLNPLSKTEVTTKRALQFVPHLDQPHQCTAGRYLFALLPNGKVLPCRRLAIEVGDIRDESFIDIYHNNSFIQKLKKPYIQTKGCEGCRFERSCNGGLRCLAYSINGDPFTKDPSCWR